MRQLFVLTFLLQLFVISFAFASVKIELSQGIIASVEKVFPEKIKSSEFEEDRYVLRIKVGKLDRTKFDLLKAVYNDSSLVVFDPDRIYFLQDFLPPYAQAFNNKVFPPIVYSYSDSNLMDLFDGGEVWPIVKNGVEISSNCWNASIEYLMSLHGLSKNEAYLYVPDMFNVATFFSSQADVVEESNIQLGDVLVVRNAEDDLLGSFIQHTAVVVGPNLVFEKVAPDAFAPYRVSFLSDIKSKFEKLMIDEKWSIPEVKFTYHRFTKEKVARVDLESLGLIYMEPISDKLGKELVKIHPEVKPKKLLQTCYPGLGGGCDPFMSQLEIFQLVTDENGLSSLKQSNGFTNLL